MSGVCAVIRLEGGPAAEGDVESMCAAAAFRGPDGSGTWSQGPAALGQLSTWISPDDKVQTGPYLSDDLVVVADARIDNPVELAHMGCATPETGNAALVAAAYRRWGTHCPERLIGDFAFVVWDRARRRLFAARDPSGLRTLVFRHEPGKRLLLASEVRQVLAAPSVPRLIDESALAAHLCGPFVDPERTFYAGISQLPPGCAIEIGAGQPRRWRFWSPQLDQRIRYADEGERASAVRHTLLASVRDRCKSTAPVGLALSGGIDSGSVACALGSLAEHGQVAPARTYSWAFEEVLSADERDVSDALADAFGFTRVPVAGDAGYPLGGWPAVRPHHDDPFHWPYEAINQRTYEAAAQNGVKVLLSGDGGDELFGDWIWDYPGMLAQGRVVEFLRRLRRHSRADGRSLRSLLVWEVAMVPWESRWPWATLTRLHPAVVAARETLSPHMRDALNPAAIMACERSRTPGLSGSGRRLRFMRILGGQARRTAAADQLAQAEHGVVKVDPFTDRRLVELVLSVPQYQVTRRDNMKALLTAGVEPLRPKGVTFRAGFSPDALWDRGMKERSVGLIRGLLGESRLDALGFTRPKLLAHEYERQLEGRASFDLTWAIGAELWLRAHWPEAV